MKKIVVGAVVVAAFASGVACAWVSKEPTASAQGAGAAAQDSKGAPMILATGGSTANTNDIAWVLTTDLYEDPKTRERIERKVLLCYKVGPNGQFCDIVDVRDITFDAKFRQLPINGHNRSFSPEVMKKEYEEAKAKTGGKP